MHADQKIDYVELPARDLERAKVFYSDVFGWTFEDYGPDYCAFNDGHLDGGFYRTDLSSSAASGAALVIVYAADLEGTRARVLDHGGTLVRDIFSFPGGRRFQFADPNGNELGVWSEE